MKKKLDTKTRGKSLPLIMTILFFTFSLVLFLIYLGYEYCLKIEINYFIRLIMITMASLFVYVGSYIYNRYLVKREEDKKKVIKPSQSIIFIYYIILLCNMVVFTRHNEINSYNLIPFQTIIDFIKNGSIYSIIINIFGNLLVFMPLEYFLIELFHVIKKWQNFTLSFTIILLIEVVQYIFKVGVFDIDDLILCTLGMIVFYFIYMELRRKK